MADDDDTLKARPCTFKRHKSRPSELKTFRTHEVLNTQHSDHNTTRHPLKVLNRFWLFNWTRFQFYFLRTTYVVGRSEAYRPLRCNLCMLYFSFDQNRIQIHTRSCKLNRTRPSFYTVVMKGALDLTIQSDVSVRLASR